MKKVSTIAAKQSRNISRQTLTIGLDLGDRNSWYCVMDEAGQIQAEQRVRTTAKTLQEAFGDMPRSRVALEIGTHSPWISRLLSELGHDQWGLCKGVAADVSATTKAKHHIVAIPTWRKWRDMTTAIMHLVANSQTRLL